MVKGIERDLDAITESLQRWLIQRPDVGPDAHILETTRPSTGYSNETILIRAAWRGELHGLVVRLPSVMPSFPDYDLSRQVAVIAAARAAGVPVPDVIAFERDADVLGSPFIVMDRVEGTVPGEAILADPFIMEASPEQQDILHHDFFEAMATLHRLDWRAAQLDDVLPHEEPLSGAAQRWVDYVHWDPVNDDPPPPDLVAAAEWCVHNAPAEAPPSSLLWGDARYGNVMCTEQRRVTCIFDFDLASIGPAEMDIAWYLSIEGLMARWVGRDVPGFPDRAGTIVRYENLLGRKLVDLEWHETFALVRAVAILSERVGATYTVMSGNDHPVLRAVMERIEHHPPAGA
jgi:aminoglycoside phosphotransferase (APT) family kinase protein